jgi:ribosomal-protein-alanine N-acetyltransferase
LSEKECLVPLRDSDQLRLVSYDPAWPAAFAAERDRIASALGARALRIDHHGSTAVPGLEAKPIIDIQVSVGSLNPLSSYAEALAEAGYFHAPHPDDAWCPFFYRPAAWPHTHHVHLVESGGDAERRTLAFRDYLRDRADVARDYALLKRELSRRYDAGELHGLEGYADAKTEFVVATTDIALAAGYPFPVLDLPIVTERLVLRDFVEQDYDAVHAFAADSDVTLHMFHGPRTPADTRDYLERTIAAQAARPRLIWELGVVHRASGAVIGACDLTVDNGGEADLGYIFRRDMWGCGYATEAVQALIDAGFAQMRLTWIYALCEAGHAASARVLEKAGLEHVRTVERHREARGRWWDMELFGIRRADWKRGPA